MVLVKEGFGNIQVNEPARQKDGGNGKLVKEIDSCWLVLTCISGVDQLRQFY